MSLFDAAADAAKKGGDSPEAAAQKAREHIEWTDEMAEDVHFPGVEQVVWLQKAVFALSDELGIGEEVRTIVYSLRSVSYGGIAAQNMGLITATGTLGPALTGLSVSVGLTIGALGGIAIAVFDIFGDDEDDAAEARKKRKAAREQMEARFLSRLDLDGLIAEAETNRTIVSSQTLFPSHAQILGKSKKPMTTAQAKALAPIVQAVAADPTNRLVGILRKIKSRSQNLQDRQLFEGVLNIARWDLLVQGYLKMAQDRIRRHLDLEKHKGQGGKYGSGLPGASTSPLISSEKIGTQILVKHYHEMRIGLLSRIQAEVASLAKRAGPMVYTATSPTGKVLARFRLDCDGVLRALSLDAPKQATFRPRVSGVGGARGETVMSICDSVSESLRAAGPFQSAWEATEQYLVDAVPLALGGCTADDIGEAEELLGEAEYGHAGAIGTMVSLDEEDMGKLAVDAVARARLTEGGVSLLQSIVESVHNLEACQAGDEAACAWAKDILSKAESGDRAAQIACGVLCRTEAALALVNDAEGALALAQTCALTPEEAISQEYGGVPASSLGEPVEGGGELTASSIDKNYGGVPASSLTDAVAGLGEGGLPHTGDVAGQDWAGNEVSPIGFYGDASVNAFGCGPVEELCTMGALSGVAGLDWNGMSVDPRGMYGCGSVDDMPVWPVETMMLDPEAAMLMGCGDVVGSAGGGPTLAERLAAIRNWDEDQGGVGFNPQPDPPRGGKFLGQMKYGAQFQGLNKLGLGGPDTSW